MAHVYASHIYNNSSCTRTSLQHHSLRHEYVLRNLCISAVYANIGPGQYRNIYFTLVYALTTLTISHLIIADFDNPQVASATNPSAFGYHYGKHMLCICLEEVYTNRSMQA